MFRWSVAVAIRRDSKDPNNHTTPESKSLTVDQERVDQLRSNYIKFPVAPFGGPYLAFMATNCMTQIGPRPVVSYPGCLCMGMCTAEVTPIKRKGNGQFRFGTRIEGATKRTPMPR